MASTLNKTFRSVVFVSCLLAFIWIGLLGAKPSVGAPLLQSTQTPGAYLPVILNGQPSTSTDPAPSVNAGMDQAITLPSSASLHGIVNDDGLPNPPGRVTVAWSKTSGPGVVTFTAANAVDTAASFSQAGDYVLRLTADDGALTAFDEVAILVKPAPVSNQPPIVNAGVDQTITLPSSANLDGTVSDDGLPNPPSQVSTTWSKVSGPDNVIFGDPNAVDTTASFFQPGVYVLQLTADDSRFLVGDQVTITINPGNQPPIVSAGANQTITLPSSANLVGVVSDDGLPNPPNHVSTTWSQTSGPGKVTFADANAVNTSATFSQAGVYVLRLTTTDGALTSFGETTIIVNAAPPLNVDGIWRGTTSYNQIVSYEIVNRGIVSFTTSYQNGGCGERVSIYTIDGSSLAPITGNSFSFNKSLVGMTIFADGTFDSNTTATGTISIVGSRCGSFSGSWSTNKAAGNRSSWMPSVSHPILKSEDIRIYTSTK